MFELTKKNIEDVIVLAVKGNLDALTAGKVKPVLEDLLASNHVLIAYDLSELQLIDSSGMGVIVSTFKRTRAKGGDAVLVDIKGQPKEVFRALNFHRYIRVYDTVEAAVKKLQKQ